MEVETQPTKEDYHSEKSQKMKQHIDRFARDELQKVALLARSCWGEWTPLFYGGLFIPAVKQLRCCIKLAGS